MSASHPSRRNIKLRNSRLLFSGAGRLFLIFQNQNFDYQKSRGQYNHEFFICTHNDHPFPQDSERMRARPPAAQVSILYFHGAVAFRFPNDELHFVIRQLVWLFIIQKSRLRRAAYIFSDKIKSLLLKAFLYGAYGTWTRGLHTASVARSQLR